MREWKYWKEEHITHRLSFLNEEEGQLSLFGGEEELFRMSIYPLGDGEAEIKVQDVGIMEQIQECQIIPEIVIRQITNILILAFEVLERAGFPEVLLLAQKATKLEEILGSTNVVQKEYSEFLLHLPPEAVKTTRDSGKQEEVLRYEEVEDGYICRNADRSFYARVSRYGEGWFVSEVEVRYDRRRTGIATACMSVLAERFLQLYLQVGSYNEPAVRLYQKLGFRTVEELCYYGKA